MKTVKQIIEEIRADIEIRPTPLDEQLDELLKSYEKEIDELSNTFADTCENLAWYINERQRLLKVIEYSKPNEGLQRTIQKALERPHGEWIKGKEISRTMLGDETLCIDYENFTCSKCGLVLDRLLYNVDGSLFYSFCPRCGSDNRPRKQGCCFADETCKNNPCKDCGLIGGEAE